MCNGHLRLQATLTRSGRNENRERRTYLEEDSSHDAGPIFARFTYGKDIYQFIGT